MFLRATDIRTIAISGKAGSGKTAVAEAIRDELNRLDVPAKRIAFGDALKDEVFEISGLRKEDPGGRAALLMWGQKRREEDIDYWVKRAIERVRHERAAGYAVVMDDLRMVNELEACQRYGFVTVRLQTPPHLRAARLRDSGHDHTIAYSPTETETALDDRLAQFDLAFRNVEDSSLQSIAESCVWLARHRRRVA